MRLAASLAAPLLLVETVFLSACTMSPPPPRPRPTRMVRRPRAPAPEPPPTPASIAAEAETDADARSTAQRMMHEWLEGLPSAPTRSGRHRVVLVRCAQEAREAGPQLAVQLQMAPYDPDVLVRWAQHVVRRYVTTDGTELTYPRQFPTVHFGAQSLSTSGIDLAGRSHRGLRDLEVDVHLVHVEEWTRRELRPLGIGAYSDHRLGPFAVGVGADEGSVSVSFAETDESPRQWRAEGGRALPDGLHHRWAGSAVRVMDANGRQLSNRGGGGSGGSTSVGFVPAPVGDAAISTPLIAYPVTISLDLPVRWRFEDGTYSFHDIPLAPPGD